MIPEVDRDATPLEQRPSCVLSVVYRLRASVRMGHLDGFVLGFLTWFTVLGVGAVRWRHGTQLRLTLRRFCWALSKVISEFLSLMSSSPFDTVDRGVLDRVLSGLGMLAWFRHAYFEYHAVFG